MQRIYAPSYFTFSFGALSSAVCSNPVGFSAPFYALFTFYSHSLVASLQILRPLFWLLVHISLMPFNYLLILIGGDVMLVPKYLKTPFCLRLPNFAANLGNSIQRLRNKQLEQLLNVRLESVRPYLY